jgi:type IV pilus assembly protein PilM
MNFFEESLSQIKDLFSKFIAQGAKSGVFLGLDIGSYSVKIVRLEPAKDGFKVLGFGVEKVIDKNYRDALSRAWVKAKAQPEESATISVAGQGVVSRYIELPAMNKGELESSMKFEIEKYVPFPLGDVMTDYAIVQETKDKSKISVLIAAAKNDLIQKKCNLAKEVNINLKGLDLDCLALANFTTELALGKEKEAGACIINLGKTVSNIDIFIDGAPQLSRDIFMGGDDITKKIAEMLDVDYAEAEKLKICPEKRKDELMSVWEPILSNLAAEIRVSLDYLEARSNKVVNSVFITGGTSLLVGIQDYLNHALGVEVNKMDYCEKLHFEDAAAKEDFKANSDFLSIALGLALR